MSFKKSALTQMARPYAQAAFEYANEQKALEEWSNMLAFVAACVQMPQVMEVLQNPRYNPTLRAEVVLTISQDVLNPAGKNFVKILADYERLSILPLVYTFFQKLCASSKKILHANIKSAISLTQTQIEQINAMLVKRFGAEIELSFEIDKALLGGLLIHIGDQVIDNTLRGRLEKLKEAVIM